VCVNQLGEISNAFFRTIGEKRKAGEEGGWDVQEVAAKKGKGENDGGAGAPIKTETEHVGSQIEEETKQVTEGGDGGVKEDAPSNPEVKKEHVRGGGRDGGRGAGRGGGCGRGSARGGGKGGRGGEESGGRGGGGGGGRVGVGRQAGGEGDGEGGGDKVRKKRTGVRI